MSQFGKQFSTKSQSKSVGNGKKRAKFRDKRRSESGNYFSATRVSQDNEIKAFRRRGGNLLPRASRISFANVLTKDGFKKVKIKAVIESRDNRNFARQGILTKGAIIETELGRAVVVNRPGREGTVNAKIVAD
ncbi:MAG: 30S ribosomal protein S8e [Candidatus Micrarchaeaceae archaeon]